MGNDYARFGRLPKVRLVRTADIRAGEIATAVFREGIGLFETPGHSPPGAYAFRGPTPPKKLKGRENAPVTP